MEVLILAGGIWTRVSESIFMIKSPLIKTGVDKKLII